MPIEQATVTLSARLRARRAEIEQATLTRVYAISDPAQAEDPEYDQGLKAAVAVAIDYGLTAIEHGEDRAPPVPAPLLAQARVAARSGVSLDTVLRRYCAGYTLLGDFLIEEAESGSLLKGSALKLLLRAQTAFLDRVLAAVTEEYGRESVPSLDPPAQHLAERVEGILDGELLNTSDLPYDFEAQHVGAIAVGPGALNGFQTLARAIDCRPLLVPRRKEEVWAWLGSRRDIDGERLERHIAESVFPQTALAIGEPSVGITGWRLSHRQARAALPIALRSSSSFVRYRNVALLASVLRDDLLATSLRELYLAPLTQERDGGVVLRQTLRAYFSADRNTSSAAAALGVSRQTVIRRLQAAERRLDRVLGSCAVEVEAALRLEELSDPLLPYGAFSSA